MTSAEEDPTAAGRPIAAVIAVTWRQEQLLLVRRHRPPYAGLWGFPGGKILGGEAVLRAAERELAEETGVRGRALEAFDAVDVIGASAPAAGHYVLVAVLVEWRAGEPEAADDVDEADWFGWEELPDQRLPDVERIAERARAILSRR